jgi:hypothetical protein
MSYHRALIARELWSAAYAAAHWIDKNVTGPTISYADRKYAEANHKYAREMQAREFDLIAAQDRRGQHNS